MDLQGGVRKTSLFSPLTPAGSGRMLLGALLTKDDMDGLDEFTSSFSGAIEQLLQQVDWPGGERPDLSPKVRLGWRR